MTILSVAKDVSLKVGLKVPLELVSASDRDGLELTSVLNEAANVIAEAHDWQRLKKVATFTGTGSAEAFNLPDDFGRMLKTANVWSSRYRDDMVHVVETDDWLELDVRAAPVVQGLWTIYADQMHVRPIMAATETVRFFYARKDIVSGGKTAFLADGDTFVLSERLLKLCAIYLWKQAKGHDFVAELSDYEIALKQEMRKDGGSLPIVSGNGRPRRSNVWPGRVSAA